MPGTREPSVVQVGPLLELALQATIIPVTRAGLVAAGRESRLVAEPPCTRQTREQLCWAVKHRAWPLGGGRLQPGCAVLHEGIKDGQELWMQAVSATFLSLPAARGRMCRARITGVR